MRAVGLYDPRFEHDACGVAFVARLDGTPSHETLERALKALANLEHRGAAGADATTGDGAGILVQIPDAFFREALRAELPPTGRYGVAVCFLPHEPERRAELEQLLEATVESELRDIARRREGPAGNAEQVRHVDAGNPSSATRFPKRATSGVIPGISCMTTTPGPSPRV